MTTKEMDNRPRSWMTSSRLSSEYDEFNPREYDPMFATDISTKMRVPDTLEPYSRNGEGDRMKQEVHLHEEIHRTASMNVPERIVVAGQDQNLGLKTEPNLHLDMMAPAPLPSMLHVGLQTPPRIITLDEQTFPAVADDRSEVETETFSEMSRSRNTSGPKVGTVLPQNGYLPMAPVRQLNDSYEDEVLTGSPRNPLMNPDGAESDMDQMRRQIHKLHRHIMQLQEDNSKRTSRELVLYPVVMGYILLQVAKWLFTNK